MRDATPDDVLDGPVFAPDTVIRTAVHAVAGERAADPGHGRRQARRRRGPCPCPRGDRRRSTPRDRDPLGGRRPSRTRRARSGPCWSCSASRRSSPTSCSTASGPCPHDDDADIFRALNGVKTFIADNREVLDPIRIGVTSLIDLFDEILASLGWPGVIGLVSALGLLFGGVRLALLSGIGFAFIGVLGLWDATMDTLAILLAAVVIALADRPAARDRRRPQQPAQRAPVADPRRDADHADVRVPGADHAAVPDRRTRRRSIATLIYALPAAIRITALGLRGVPHDTVEAASAFGADGHADAAQGRAAARAPRHRPRHQPDDHAQPVDGRHRRPDRRARPRRGTSWWRCPQVDVGTAFEAGLAIVILAIVLDRLTDAAGEWLSPRARIARRRSGRPGWQRLIGARDRCSPSG